MKFNIFCAEAVVQRCSVKKAFKNSAKFTGKGLGQRNFKNTTYFHRTHLVAASVCVCVFFIVGSYMS